MGVFLRESLLPEAVSLGRLYMCGFGELRCLSVSDSGLMSLSARSFLIASVSLTSGRSGAAQISQLWYTLW